MVPQMSEQPSSDELATRRLIIWSARLRDLWEPKDIADFMERRQKIFGGMRPIDMMKTDEGFDRFDRHMRALLDGVHS